MMMHRNEKLEIAARLSRGAELSPAELEVMLEEELSRPEADMDTELVQQLLELVEEAPAPHRQPEAWQQTATALRSARRRPVFRALARTAAAVVILAALLGAAYGTASALNWGFLLRWMRPFTETFTLYSGSDSAPQPTQAPIAEDGGVAFTQHEFASLADCPDRVDGYPAKPLWMPERFEYLSGSMYSDGQLTSVTHVFGHERGVFIMDIMMISGKNQSDAYAFEQQPDGGGTAYAVGSELVIYRNADNGALTASWMCENVHYTLTGSADEDELRRIHDAMMK